MILEIYTFTFLFVLGVLIYAWNIYWNNINDNERHLLLMIILIPLLCLILVL